MIKKKRNNKDCVFGVRIDAGKGKKAAVLRSFANI